MKALWWRSNSPGFFRTKGKESNPVKPKILLVDDEETLLKQMRWALDADYEVFTASKEPDAVSVFTRERPAVVTVDLSLNTEIPGDLGGLRLVERFLTEEPSTRVIVVTGNDDEHNAIDAVRLGAFDYYSKPIHLEEIKVMIQRALNIHQLHQRLSQSYGQTDGGFQGIIGQSKSMQEIFKFIRRIAPSDISVLITGESGTGKEMVAKAIHQQSSRNDNPFVALNCGAIPENLLESELFGYEKGAFTGAYAQKRGKFEVAHTGTLFLDEIGELAQALQVKLLRFLQDRKIERVGGHQSLEVDVRIIAATNRDLKKDMENHIFREDLYYRLKVVPLDIPPLRKRREDIIPLARYFLNKYCQEHRKPLVTLSSEAENSLLMQPWPGNVRELENLLSRAVVLTNHSVLSPNDFGFGIDSVVSEVNLKFAKKAIEIDFVKKALSKNKGIVSRAARELGISRVNLYDLIEKYQIEVQEFKINRARTK
jgi:two-component system NtrC family response regulator